MSHQDRVIQELRELSDKIGKLDVFILTNPIFKTLSEIEQFRLKTQVEVMNLYATILAARIKDFKCDSLS